jgi:hypothetical protein
MLAAVERENPFARAAVAPPSAISRTKKKKVALSFFLALDSIRPKNYSRAPDG